MACAPTGSTAVPTVRGATVRAIEVPLARPLVTRVVTVERALFLLIDLQTDAGVTGRAYKFIYLRDSMAPYRALLQAIARRAAGSPLAPAALFDRLRGELTLLGHEGMALAALGAFDVACWDALARHAGRPLAELLGAERHRVPAYNSNGLGLAAPQALAAEAPELLAGGFRAVKIRLGRAELADDLAAVRAVRGALPADAALMSDFNQALTVEEALRRGRALDGEGLAWVEEPVIYDDLEGSARVSAALETPVQIGENLYGPRAVARALAAEAGDYLMFDLQRIGGVTGWLRAAAHAETANVPVSSHLMPEVSAHLLAATPTRHWLEYVDWAAPVLVRPLAVEDGCAVIPEAPGTGVDWDEEAVARYAVDL